MAKELYTKKPCILSPHERAPKGTRLGLIGMGLFCHQKSPIFYRQSKEPYRALVQGSSPALCHIQFHQRFLSSIGFVTRALYSFAYPKNPNGSFAIKTEPFILSPVERALQGAGLRPFCTGLFCHKKSPIFHRLSKEPRSAQGWGSFPALYHIQFHQRFLSSISFVTTALYSFAYPKSPNGSFAIKTEPFISSPVERALQGAGSRPFCTGLFCH